MPNFYEIKYKLLIVTLFASLAGCADSNSIESVMDTYIERNQYEEDKESIRSVAKDIDADGNDEYAYYNINYCGTAGCFADVYMMIDGDYCNVGYIEAESFEHLEGRTANYSCLKQEEQVYVGLRSELDPLPILKAMDDFVISSVTNIDLEDYSASRALDISEEKQVALKDLYIAENKFNSHESYSVKLRAYDLNNDGTLEYSVWNDKTDVLVGGTQAHIYSLQNGNFCLVGTTTDMRSLNMMYEPNRQFDCDLVHLLDNIQTSHDLRMTKMTPPDDPFNIELESNPTYYGGYKYYVNVISKTEVIRVHEITMNRGNCSVEKPRLSRLIGFGHKIQLEYNCSAPLEMTVESNFGSYEFIFDQ